MSIQQLSLIAEYEALIVNEYIVLRYKGEPIARCSLKEFYAVFQVPSRSHTPKGK